MKNLQTTKFLSMALFAALASSCADNEFEAKVEEIETPDDSQDSVGGDGNTFDHPNPLIDPFAVLARLQDEGPASFTSRVHACGKVRYATLGRMLASRGVDLTATDPISAGALYTSGMSALGRGDLTQRQRESGSISTASAARNFDIFVQAAPEIIAAMPTLEACEVNGAGIEFFDAGNKCNRDAITCLIGVPATNQHVSICDLTVTSAADVESGKRLAVATILAAGNTCE